MKDCSRIKDPRICILVMIRHKVNHIFKVVVRFWATHISCVIDLLEKSAFHRFPGLSRILLISRGCLSWSLWFQRFIGEATIILLMLGLKVRPLCNSSRDDGGWPVNILMFDKEFMVHGFLLGPMDAIIACWISWFLQNHISYSRFEMLLLVCVIVVGGEDLAPVRFDKITS